MAKATVLLLIALAAAAAAAVTATAAGGAGLPARRSRFLLVNGRPSYPYECSKMSAAVCLAPGSPGPICCRGQCVDTIASADHCGGCNKACKHGRTCCAGRCVDLLSDKDNCGSCSKQCSKKCTSGFCDYAQ